MKKECQAKNPEACRYHGSSTYSERTVAKYVAAVKAVDEAHDVRDRHKAEETLAHVRRLYASTDEGAEALAAELESTDDWVEKERIEEDLKAGARIREMEEDRLNRESVMIFPTSMVPEAVRRIDKANRKLQRAGLEEQFTYEREDYVVEEDDGTFTRMTRFELNKPTLRAGDYDFVGAVDPLPGGEFITRNLPGQELNGFTPETFKCDHCDQNRRRTSTYLLKDRNTGELKQVGKSCLQAFTGVRPTTILWAIEHDPEADEFVDNGERHRGGDDSVSPTEDTLAIAVALSDGGKRFVSAGVAQDTGKRSTASLVRRELYERKPADEAELIVTDEDRALAARILKETKFDDNSDYGANMNRILKNEYVSPRHLGFLASAISAHQRQMGKAAEAAAKVRSVGFLADKGEKLIDIPLTVVRNVPTSYSAGYYEREGSMLIMQNSQGQLVKWASSNPQDYSPGDSVIVRSATVKDHGEYNGDDQTVITRAKLIDADPESAAE